MSPRPPFPSDRLRDVYEQRAALEYAVPRALPDPALDRKFERIVELVAACAPFERFLDAGCGDGRYLAALGARGLRPSHAAGCDLSGRIAEVAAETARRHGVEAVTRQANLERLPYPDGSFDAVLCAQVLEHLLDPAAGMRELARVAAPGGRLVLTTDNDRALVSRALNAPRATVVHALRLRPRYVKVDFPHVTFTPAAFRTLVEDARLVVEHEETFRFSLQSPLDVGLAQRLLNGIDRLLPAHGLGDIVAIVARRPT